jgi:flavorubredoxin
MAERIRNNVYWVGTIDWELTRFHGDEYSTHRGSSYNAYLIREEKNVLIDTVWEPFAEDFVENLAREIDLEEIDYIVVNHSEVDHSGALVRLMEQIPDTPIYATARGKEILTGHYHRDWDIRTVKTGDTLEVGDGKQLMFIEAAMLHWPDSMFCYLTGDNILFSNDAFGQHYASEHLYNDRVDQNELYEEAIKYYANILTPFSRLVSKKIDELKSLGVPVDIIAPSHGVIWREDPLQIVEHYAKWADSYQEDRIAVLYDTMWQGTRAVAEAIAEGIAAESPNTEVRLFNLASRDKNDVMTEVFRSKGIAVGSPTINRGILTSVAAELEHMRGLGFTGKRAAAFGCYGWSGESVKMIRERLQEAGFKIHGQGLSAKWRPDTEALEHAREYGRGFAAAFTAERVE